MLRLTFLGTSEITLNRQSLSTQITGKGLALFIYLAATHHAHTRDKLANLLWSELSNQQARSNLRYLLSDIRQVVGDYLYITPQYIGFNREHAYWFDAEALQTSLATQATTNLQARQTALALYQGEFLAGFHARNAPIFEEWVIQKRQELHILAIQGFYTLAESCYQTQNWQAGLEATQRLLQLEPWHETGHRLRMQLLAATGQRSAALVQYDQCGTILADELGVEPEAATKDLYEQIRNGEFTEKKPRNQEIRKPAVVERLLASQFPMPSTTLPHNLPSNLTPFLGRDAEVTQINALLADTRYRLFTLVGEGGSGKTRLALAIAQKILEATPDHSRVQSQHPKFSDGVWFVSLGTLTTTGNLVDQLVVAVAQAIGLSFGSDQPLLAQLLAYLHNKRLLLLLDNAEHLLPEVADFLISLLQAGPALTAIVTSRHLLGLQAEFVWRMTGLEVPPDADLTSTALLHYSSVALFVERAKRLQYNFRLTPENQAAIAAICRLVDGLPLAIELAAALIKRYSSAALYKALQHDYKILATTVRDLPARHRSIKAMLDYSWRLLRPAEARLLAACAAFPGSFDLAAITAVADATWESITRLVDQSLLNEVQAADGQRRYVLHPLVHRYATEQLQLQPAVVHHVHTAHCKYYLDFLMRHSAMLGRDPRALPIIQMELDHLRAAWAWAIAQSHFELLRQCSKSLAQFYKVVGFYEEAEAAFRQAAESLARIAADTNPLPTAQMRLLAMLQVEQAHFCARLAQVERAETLAHAALQVSITLNDGPLRAQSYLCLAISRTRRGDYAGARTASATAVVEAQAAAQPDLEAWAAQNLGIIELADGQLSQGLTELRRALTIAEMLEDRHLEALIRGSLGSGYYIAGNFAYAHRNLQETWQTSQMMKLPRVSIVARSWLSSLYIQIGHYDLATQHALEAQQGARQLGRHSVELESCALFALAKYHQNDLTIAARYCQDALQLAEKHKLGRYTALTYLVQGHLYSKQAEWQAAAAAYSQATQAYVNHIQPLWTLRAQAGQAQCQLMTGNLTHALAAVEELWPLLAERGQGGGMNVYETILISYEILNAAADPRAAILLQQGYHMLQQQAAHFDDPALRHAFLEQVAANRQLAALWSARRQ